MTSSVARLVAFTVHAKLRNRVERETGPQAGQEVVRSICLERKTATDAAGLWVRHEAVNDGVSLSRICQTADQIPDGHAVQNAQTACRQGLWQLTLEEIGYRVLIQPTVDIRSFAEEGGEPCPDRLAEFLQFRRGGTAPGIDFAIEGHMQLR